jgi:hypothetical protein
MWFERLFWLPLVWMHACVVREGVRGWRFAIAGAAMALGVAMKAADVARCDLPRLLSSTSFGLFCGSIVAVIFTAAWLRLPGVGRVLAWSTWRTLAVGFQLGLFLLFDFGVLPHLMIVAGSVLAGSTLLWSRDATPERPSIASVSVAAVVGLHVICLWTWALPSGIGCRTTERGIVAHAAGKWLRELDVRQRWRMFAGGGGHANESVTTRIYDRDGILIGSGGEVIDELRAGRGGRRSDGRWFAPYLARYECHRSDWPDAYAVVVVRITQPIPSSRAAWERGIIVWPSLDGPTQQRVLYEGKCADLE